MLAVRLEGASAPTLLLSPKPGAAVELVDDAIHFELGDDAIYLSSAEGRVTAPPPDEHRLALTRSSTYRLTLDFARTGDGEVALWIIEFAGAAKIAQHSRRLEGSRIALTWNTDPRHDCALLALRLRGKGTLRIERAQLQELAPELEAVEAPAEAPARRLVTDPAPPYVRPVVSVTTLDPEATCAIAPLDLGARFDRDHEFAVLQLELLWQKGLIDAVDLRGSTARPPRLTAWMERRQIPEAPCEPARIEHVRRRRAQLLAHPERLAFPPVPETPEDCRAQGFVIVRPDAFPAAEFADAKTFWKDYGVRSWYQVDKPWTGWLARWVEAIRPRRVLEFGCNVGRNLAGIRDLCPGVELVGLDINAEAIAAGREHHGLDLRVADERSLAELGDGEFDAVFTVSVLDHMSEIGDVCRELLRVASRHALFFEVRLPIEGRVVEHHDHKAGAIKRSTGASYSWHVERYLTDPRLTELAILPTYLHSASLGPYYAAYFASLG